MKKVLTLLLVFGLVLVGISSTTSAFGYLNGGNGDCVFEEELDLTDNQVKQLTVVREKFDTERSDLQEEIREYNRSREDKSKIEELRSQLETLREEYMTQVEKILNEEQLSQVDFDPKINMHEGSQGRNKDVQQKGNRNSSKKGKAGQRSGRKN